MEKNKKGQGLLADRRGAVLAEFVVAIFPLLTIFFVFVQLAFLAIASIIVKHSAVVGARAAAVFSNVNQNVPELCGDNGQQKVDEAVRAALGPWSRNMTTTVRVTDQSSRSEDDGVYDLVTVRVTAQVTCSVPLGRVICGAGGTKEINDTKSMPHQGARYITRQCEGAAGGPFTGGGGDFGGAGASGDF